MEKEKVLLNDRVIINDNIDIITKNRIKKLKKKIIVENVPIPENVMESNANILLEG